MPRSWQNWKFYIGEIFMSWFFSLCASQMSKETLMLWLAFVRSYAKDANLKIPD